MKRQARGGAFFRKSGKKNTPFEAVSEYQYWFFSKAGKKITKKKKAGKPSFHLYS